MRANAEDRARNAATKAVGKSLRLRLDAVTLISGMVTDCRFVGMVPAGRNVKPQFEVSMSCGVNHTPRTFTVTKLP